MKKEKHNGAAYCKDKRKQELRSVLFPFNFTCKQLCNFLSKTLKHFNSLIDFLKCCGNVTVYVITIYSKSLTL